MSGSQLGGARTRDRSLGWRAPALAALAFLLAGLPEAPPPSDALVAAPAGEADAGGSATTATDRFEGVGAAASPPASVGTSAPRVAPAPRAEAAGALPVGAPTSVSVPAIDVDAPIVTLGLNADGTLEVPASTGDTGWYRYGPRPGEEGPAVIAGHVDSRAGPAVFYRLRDLRPGDVMVVGYDGGHAVRFRVTRVEQHPKDAFPTARVYGRTNGAELRLITCGGTFDGRSRHYRDNVIVFAEVI